MWEFRANYNPRIMDDTTTVGTDARTMLPSEYFDGNDNVSDLLALLANWEPCP